jgi:hypothetical protein
MTGGANFNRYNGVTGRVCNREKNVTDLIINDLPGRKISSRTFSSVFFHQNLSFPKGGLYIGLLEKRILIGFSI